MKERTICEERIIAKNIIGAAAFGLALLWFGAELIAGALTPWPLAAVFVGVGALAHAQIERRQLDDSPTGCAAPLPPESKKTTH